MSTITRFRGRYELIRLADKGNSLAALALAMPARLREIAALRGELPMEVVKALDLPSVEAANELRKARARRPVDTLAERQPGNVPARALFAAFRKELRRMGFRTATHMHETHVLLVERGQERASSTNGTVSSRTAGKCNAYAKKAFYVATSEHEYRISADFWRVPKGERALAGKLYLSPTVRVRQGRGASLVMERLSGKKWA